MTRSSLTSSTPRRELGDAREHAHVAPLADSRANPLAGFQDDWLGLASQVRRSRRANGADPNDGDAMRVRVVHKAAPSCWSPLSTNRRLRHPGLRLCALRRRFSEWRMDVALAPRFGRWDESLDDAVTERGRHGTTEQVPIVQEDGSKFTSLAAVAFALPLAAPSADAQAPSTLSATGLAQADVSRKTAGARRRSARRSRPPARRRCRSQLPTANGERRNSPAAGVTLGALLASSDGGQRDAQAAANCAGLARPADVRRAGLTARAPVARRGARDGPRHARRVGRRHAGH